MSSWLLLAPLLALLCVPTAGAVDSNLEIRRSYHRFHELAEQVGEAEAAQQSGMVIDERVAIVPRRALEGWTGREEVQGRIPLEELPHMLNPEAGYISHANNLPVGAWYAWDLADVDNSRAMIAPGNAEDSAGPHRTNQMDLWVRGTTRPAWQRNTRRA
jgi:acyl-homoserine lactone acylase PvdQ